MNEEEVRTLIEEVIPGYNKLLMQAYRRRPLDFEAIMRARRVRDEAELRLLTARQEEEMARLKRKKEDRKE